ncbi:ribonuclease P protein component [Arsenicitalea aurantiaca]|uniref:Ribonuclease P protein component n=1 Tax=Arsenicitalea aurantiaca TaxID=1783274 RepID=A0A433X2D0_9HYPH|nr:ribonuclease P protein component [Arsenicitalea aurantiaca]
MKRREFLRAARGSRAGRAGFSLQAIAGAAEVPGLGFTVTRKTGNSPERSRIKRRLRAASEACSSQFRPHHDYVLIGRREALTVPFEALVEGLSGAIARVHAGKAQSQRPPGNRNETQ